MIVNSIGSDRKNPIALTRSRTSTNEKVVFGDNSTKDPHMKKHPLLYLWMVCLSLPMAACMSALPRGQVNGPQTYKVAIDFQTGGFHRNFHVHVPPAYDGTTPLPLLIVIHGAFGTAKEIEKRSGFSQLADREGFMVMYPNGIGIAGLLQHWNAGHCCGKAAEDRIDDVGYLNASIDAASSRLAIDTDRIYMVGFSNGGMLTYRFCAESGSRLAGAAVLAGAIGSRLGEAPPMWTMPQSAPPVPMLIIHGLQDTHVPFNGGSLKPADPPRHYDSVEDAVAYWIRQNGCPRDRETFKVINPWVRLQQWETCSSRLPVRLYTIGNWAHTWPGGTEIAALDGAHPMKGFEAAKLIWTFFQEQSGTNRR
jgi:polyhydroxybutyrate depolymerase